MIRRSAQPGDWVVGLTPKSKGNKLLYAMKVAEKLTFDEYWRKRRFARKKAQWGSSRLINTVGDNIYEPLSDFEYRQLPSCHSDDDVENPDNKKHDLNGKFVLVAEDFYYFGSSPEPLPHEFKDLIVVRGHKCRFPDELASAFERWIQGFKMGVNAPPTKWREADKSWRQGC